MPHSPLSASQESHRPFLLLACSAIVGSALLLSACTKSDGSTADPAIASTVEPGGTEPAAASGRLHAVVNVASSTQVSGAMKIIDDPTAADGKCLRVDLGEGKTPETAGSATLSIDVPAAKTAKFWIRAYWTGTCANSVTLKVPGFPEQIVGEDGTYNKWHWIPGPTFPLPAGKMDITLAQREDDIRIDQVIVTANSHFVPVDIEK